MMRHMKSQMRIAALFAALFLTLALAGCGGGGDGGGGSPPGPVNQAPPGDGGGGGGGGTQLSLANTVMFYVATSSSSSQYLPEYDITLDATTQHIIRYIPAQNRAEVVLRNFSPSFATSTAVPYTVDDRYFVRTESRGLESGGQHKMDEYDPLTGSQILTFRVFEPYYFADGCSAVAGDSYFYRRTPAWDLFLGDTGGEFKRVTFSNVTDPSPQTLLAADDPDNCKGNLTSSNGKLYDAVYDAGLARLYVRDLATGRISVRREFAVTNPSLYDATSYRFAFDGNTAYFVRKRTSDGLIELWSYAVSSLAASSATLIYSDAIANFNADYMDADNGRVAIGGSASGKILLFDTGSGSATLYDLGLSFYAMQILYVTR